MKQKKLFRILLILGIILVIIGCDQISKSIARKNIEYHQQIHVIHNFFTLTRVENTGAFLSLGDSLPRWLYKSIMIVLPIFVLGFAFYYLLYGKDLSNLIIVGISIIIGGGAGNIYDRILYGSVTDFMHMDFGLFQTGIFNIADFSVLVGIGLVLIDSYLKKRKIKVEVSQ